MPLLMPEQFVWLKGVIEGLTALSDNRWMMPTNHLRTILWELAAVIERQVGGAVVEMGCAGGRTTLRLAAFLQLLGEGPGRPLHAYDSFQGFPALAEEDMPGDVDGSRQNFRYPVGGLPGLFADWGDGLPAPTIHVGFWGAEGEHPDPIALALIDCDVGASVREALGIVWPRLAPGGTVLVHDFGNPRWPGVKVACEAFFAPTTRAEVERWLLRHETLLTVTKRKP